MSIVLNLERRKKKNAYAMHSERNEINMEKQQHQKILMHT